MCGDGSLYQKIKSLAAKEDYISVNFFNKVWRCKLKSGLKLVAYKDFEKIDPSGTAALKGFLTKSAKISKDIENEFCKIATKYGKDFTPKLEFDNYKDFKELTVTSISIELKYAKHEYSIVLRGEYDADPEHGWSMKFSPNGDWIGGIKHHSS